MTAGEASTSTSNRLRLFRWSAIVLLALGSAALSLAATRTKSATFDEPVHLLSSWLIVNKGDFRVNPEHPPLWKMIAGIPLFGARLDIDLASPQADAVLQQIENQGPLATDLLYRGVVDGPALLSRARVMMSLFLFACVLIVARWAYAASGWGAALIASTLIAFDPNFLAHGSLLTNDVAASFVFTAAGYLTWQLGRRFAWPRAFLLALTCAAGAAIKFTCVLLIPIIGVPFLVRALSGRPWDTSTHTLQTRGRRLLRGIDVLLATAAFTFAALWCVYLLRVAPTNDGKPFDADYPRNILAYNAIMKQAQDAGTTMTDSQIKAAVPGYRPSAPLRAVYFLQNHHFIPQALGYGLTYAAGRGILRPAFLMGDYSDRGFWLYFPVAIATKTPLITLALFTAAAILGLATRKTWATDPEKRWLLLCLLSCPAIYLTLATVSNLNIGIRHILPIYPAMYVAIGIALARLIRTARPARYVVPGALLLLAAETTSAYPNYLSFFNRAAGGERGGLSILGDSNLDWGQDLPALARWYRAWRIDHPDDAFYLAYFGSADPHAYGIDYVNMSPGYVYDTRPPTLDLNRDGVVAVSATWLQGTFPEHLRPMMANLRAREPITILNGSIYLYDFKRPTASTDR